MIILAFDTSMGACSAAVVHLENGRLGDVSATFEVMNKGHAEQLLPMIKAVLDKGGLGFDEIDRIAVTTGPGTFTGVRIGVATARGLALASKKPIVSTTSLHVIALTWLRQVIESQQDYVAKHSEIAVVMDARRGDVYLQCFSLEGEAADSAQILSVGDAACYLKKRSGRNNQVMIGNGARLLYPDAQEDAFLKDSRLFLPDAYDLAVIAGDLTVTEAKVSPLYLRAADAKTQSGKAIARK